MQSIILLLVLGATEPTFSDISTQLQRQINDVYNTLNDVTKRIAASEVTAKSIAASIKGTQDNITATQENLRATQQRLAKLNEDATALAKSLEKANERADAIIALISPETAETVLQNVSMKREILARSEFEKSAQKRIDEFEVNVQKKTEDAERRIAITESAVESVRANVITMLFAVIGSLVVGVGSIIGFGVTILKTVSSKQVLVRERPTEPPAKRIVTDVE